MGLGNCDGNNRRVFGMKIGEYRGFEIHEEEDGWYAETAGGTCLGPFEWMLELHEAVNAHLTEYHDGSDYAKT